MLKIKTLLLFSGLLCATGLMNAQQVSGNRYPTFPLDESQNIDAKK